MICLQTMFFACCITPLLRMRMRRMISGLAGIMISLRWKRAFWAKKDCTKTLRLRILDASISKRSGRTSDPGQQRCTRRWREHTLAGCTCIGWLCHGQLGRLPRILDQQRASFNQTQSYFHARDSDKTTVQHGLLLPRWAGYVGTSAESTHPTTRDVEANRREAYGSQASWDATQRYLQPLLNLK